MSAISRGRETVQELDACFIATDSAGQKLAFIYFEDERQQSCSHAM
jgi:hypothetical protein